MTISFWKPRDGAPRDGQVRVRIRRELDPFNPRKEWDNFGVMVCWHRRYDLGDRQPDQGESQAIELAMLREFQRQRASGTMQTRVEAGEVMSTGRRDVFFRYLRRRYGTHVVLPLRLYDHSGLSLSVGSGASPFDPGGWDSGTVGWIMDTREQSQHLGVTTTDTDQIRRWLEQEVETYDRYLQGDVWGYEVEVYRACTQCGRGEWEYIDSCWSFYGHEPTKNGMAESIDEQYLAGLLDAELEYE